MLPGKWQYWWLFKEQNFKFLFEILPKFSCCIKEKNNNNKVLILLIMIKFWVMHIVFNSIYKWLDIGFFNWMFGFILGQALQLHLIWKRLDRCFLGSSFRWFSFTFVIYLKVTELMLYIWRLKLAIGYSASLHQPDTKEKECYFLLKCMFQHVALDIPLLCLSSPVFSPACYNLYSSGLPGKSGICFKALRLEMEGAELSLALKQHLFTYRSPGKNPWRADSGPCRRCKEKHFHPVFLEILHNWTKVPWMMNDECCPKITQNSYSFSSFEYTPKYRKISKLKTVIL